MAARLLEEARQRHPALKLNTATEQPNPQTQTVSVWRANQIIANALDWSDEAIPKV